MSYIKSTIINGEEIIQDSRMSKWFFAKDITIAIIAIIVGVLFLNVQHRTNTQVLVAGICFVFGVGMLINVYITYISTELAFTNKRVIAKVGFIRRDTIEININKVEAIQVHQGLLGRLLNFGTIIISGAGNPQAPIKGISAPIQFRTKFMEYTSNNA